MFPAGIHLIQIIAVAVCTGNPLPLSPAAGSAAASAPYLQAVTLRYKFALGEMLKYQIYTKARTGNFGGINISTGTGNASYTVQTVGVDESATLLYRAPSFHIDTLSSHPFGLVSLPFQAEAKPEPTDSPISTDYLKRGYSMVLSPTGHTLSVDGLFPSPASDAVTQFTVSAATGCIAILPDHLVKIGDSWRGVCTLGALGALLDSQMTLVALDSSSADPIATISVKYGMGMPSTPFEAITEHMAGSGIVKFDINRGAMISSRIEMAPDPTRLPEFLESSGQMKAEEAWTHLSLSMQLAGAEALSSTLTKGHNE